MSRPLRFFPLVALILVSVALPAAARAETCPADLVCSTVTVRLDRTGVVPGTIDLPVVVGQGDGPLMILLGGGPGQSMYQYGQSAIPFYQSLAPGYRVALLDQRGTGQNALECPALQFAGLTDLTPPPPGSIQACGRKLGDSRGFYSTTDTVADLDAVRRSLGAEKMSLYGISYGTYVAERYARAHPRHTESLVLDSVVPQENVGPFFTAGMRRFAVILRQLCGFGVCNEVTKDPVTDLSRLVKRADQRAITGRVRVDPGQPLQRVRVDSVALYDLAVSLASADSRGLATFPAAVKSALRGRPAPLLRLSLGINQKDDDPSSASSQSWGLHTAVLCGDIVRWPWGGPDTPVSGRRSKVLKAVRKLPAGAFGPFSRKTAIGNGALLSCQRWQRTEVPRVPRPGPLPKVPTLIFAGGWDLSTPLSEARKEASHSQTAKLVVIPNAGHSSSGFLPCTLPILRRFYTGQQLGKPCARNKPEL